MARLDIRRVQRHGRIRLVVELQSNYARDLPTVVVAPLIPIDDARALPYVNPIVEHRGQQFAVRLEQMLGIPVGELGQTMGSLSDREYEIATAINRLLFYV